MTYYRLGAFALLLGLTGCSQIAGEDLGLSSTGIGAERQMPIETVRFAASADVERSALLPLTPTPPSGFSDVAHATTGSVTDNRPLSAAEGVDGPAPSHTLAPRSDVTVVGMTRVTSPLMDLANMADWSGYKIKRFLPPSLVLPIINIDEIRIALTSDTMRYAPSRMAGACLEGSAVRQALYQQAAYTTPCTLSY